MHKDSSFSLCKSLSKHFPLCHPHDQGTVTSARQLMRTAGAVVGGRAGGGDAGGRSAAETVRGARSGSGGGRVG